jgi:hypothetical protein
MAGGRPERALGRAGFGSIGRMHRILDDARAVDDFRRSSLATLFSLRWR